MPELISPSGAAYHTDNAVEMNDLIYGQGYRIRDDPNPAPEAPTTGSQPAEKAPRAREPKAAQ